MNKPKLLLSLLFYLVSSSTQGGGIIASGFVVVATSDGCKLLPNGSILCPNTNYSAGSLGFILCPTKDCREFAARPLEQ